MPWWHHNSTTIFRHCMGLMTSQLCIFWTRPILWAFVVPKLLLICTKVGWSAQPYSINFAFTHGSSARIHFLTFISLLEEMHLHEGSDQGNCLSLWRNVETRAGEKKAQLPMGFEPTNSGLEGRCSNRCASTTTAQVMLNLMYEAIVGFGQWWCKCWCCTQKDFSTLRNSWQKL